MAIRKNHDLQDDNTDEVHHLIDRNSNCIVINSNNELAAIIFLINKFRYHESRVTYELWATKKQIH